jgi:hypothetical protein
MRYLFNVTVTLSTPCGSIDKYKIASDALAEAMCAVLASKDSLLDLCKAGEDMLESAHVECEVTRDGAETIVANAVLDVEASEAVQLNKPMLTKAFKAKLGALGTLRVEKRLLTEEA